MKGSTRKFRAKARRLLRLYSLWHETHQEELEQQCLKLLGEIMTAEPRFSLRREFQQAF